MRYIIRYIIRRINLEKTIIFFLPALIIMFSFKCGWSWEWIEINNAVFKNKAEKAHYFQEAAFNRYYIYVITSDSNDSGDPNRKTCLWASAVKDDMSSWRDESSSLWREHDDLNGVRQDKLFSEANFTYAGVYDNNECKVFKLLNPNDTEEIEISTSLTELAKWRVTNGRHFDDRLYIGIFEKDFGSKVLFWDIVNEKIANSKNRGLISFGNPDILGVSLLESLGGKLFIGTRQRNPGARLYYLRPDSDNLESFAKESFKNPEGFEDIISYVSLIDFSGKLWLLTESTDRDSGKKIWSLWESDKSAPDISAWELRFSSKERKYPFYDPNIIYVSALHPIGKYLYIAVLFKDGGQIWKGYLGEKWLPVPFSVFYKDNLLKDIFHNPDNTDYIFAGINDTDNGVHILARLVPRIEVEGFSEEENRFISPNNITIEKIRIKPNWDDPNYSQNKDGASVSIISPRGVTSAIMGDASFDGRYSWNFIDIINKINEEGVYALKWKMINTNDTEEAIKHVCFAWDSNAPLTPGNVRIVPGNMNIVVYWAPSEDHSKYKFKKDLELMDSNFSESFLFKDFPVDETLKGYILEYWSSKEPVNLIRPGIIPAHQTRYKITEVQNFETYKIRIRAVDIAGNISEWSEEVEGTPQPTLGLTDITGEKGGCFIFSLNPKKGSAINKKRRWIGGVKGGFYEFRSKETKLVYGDDTVWPFQADIGLVLNPVIEAGFTVGYMQMEGMGLMPYNFNKSEDPLTFRILPCSFTLRWLPLHNTGWLPNPYIGGGIDIWLYKEDKFISKNIDGSKYGYHGVFGLRILLDPFDTDHAEIIYDDFGIIDTYFILEAVYNSIDNFGKSRLDLGGLLYQAGIMFLF